MNSIYSTKKSLSKNFASLQAEHYLKTFVTLREKNVGRGGLP